MSKSMIVFPKEEYEARWQKVYREMKRRGYAVALIWGKGACTWDRMGDLLWLVNHYNGHPAQSPDNNLWQCRGFSAVIMRPGHQPELHIDEYLDPCDWLATDNWQWHMNPVKGVGESLVKHRIEGKVAFVGSDFFPIRHMKILEETAPNVQFVPEDDLVKKVMHVKSARELEVFREAGEIVTTGFNKMMEGLVAGKTQADAAADGAGEIIRRGGMPYIIKVSHGKNDVELTNFASYPLTGADFASAPEKGDLVRGWIMGPMRHGYFLDPGRSAVCGRKPTRDQRDLLESCIRIVDGVLNKIKAGALAHDLAREGDRIAGEVTRGGSKDAAAEQWPLYGHLCDHMFENPMYGLTTCDADERLEAGMVCSSEAFVTWPGVGAVGFEQNVIVTQNGFELITTTPMRYWD